MSELLFDRINGLIADATFARNDVRMLTLRAIKAELLKAKTAKNAKPLDQNMEFQILKKMVKQREESAKLYEEANRLELAANEKAEISILLEFIPEEPGIDEIELAIATCGIEPFKSNMGSIIKVVKERYPTADGKLVAETVKLHLV
jgi:uncharacterized protein YqeY